MTDQDLGDYQPTNMDVMDQELQRKKRRRRIIIILLIIFGSLIGIGVIVFVALLLFTEALATVCVNACGTACEDSCNNACSNACNGSDMVNADIGDSSFNAQEYISFAWETLKDWFHNLFS